MAYKIEHTKSTIAVNGIDLENKQLGYFHGQGYYHVNGDDFLNLFHLQITNDPAILPPYVEFVKRRSVPTPSGDELTRVSLRLLQRQLSLLPESNPFQRFKSRFANDLKWLANEALDTFHKYSFATLRQFGACYELATTYLRWLKARNVNKLDTPIAAFEALSTGAKTLQFQLARAIGRKKLLDLTSLDEMALLWQTGMDEVKAIPV
jgi:hypothetical protein